MKSYTIGIDVGGTNIKLGLVDSRGKIKSKASLATEGFIAEKSHLIQALCRSVSRVIRRNRLTRRQIRGIGVGVPGLVNFRKGEVRFLTNIPGWKNVPLKRILEDRLHLPVLVDNDVNLMALAEWRYGAGKGAGNVVCLTLGTGVGGGLIINDELYRGEGDSAGELGHIPLNENGRFCNCGGRGCLETYIGKKALLEKAEKMGMKKGITLEEITRRARARQKKAMRFWEETGRILGNGLVAVVNLLNPQKIIVGGGISNAYPHISPAVKDVLKKCAMAEPASMVQIVKARLGNEAGVIGCRVLMDRYL